MCFVEFIFHNLHLTLDRCLSFCTVYFGHCVVCSSSIYGFCLPLRYPQTLLTLCIQTFDNLTVLWIPNFKRKFFFRDRLFLSFKKLFRRYQLLVEKYSRTYDEIWYLAIKIRVMVFNSTFNNISLISWRSVVLVDETGVPGENHRPAASHWKALSRIVVSSTPRHERDSNSHL